MRGAPTPPGADDKMAPIFCRGGGPGPPVRPSPFCQEADETRWNQMEPDETFTGKSAESLQSVFINASSGQRFLFS
jgi:hypothetical protein